MTWKQDKVFEQKSFPAVREVEDNKWYIFVDVVTEKLEDCLVQLKLKSELDYFSHILTWFSSFIMLSNVIFLPFPPK